MRHRKKGRALGRTAEHRKALLRNLATSVLEHEHARTTTAKAKEVRPLVERLITWAKRGDLHARRLAGRYVRDRAVLRKLFESLGPRYAGRNGGYTRIVKLGTRVGDGAEEAIIELVDRAA
ncbi:MAG: 50S ribosomal protein L17 [Gemmatimonadetes bacterium]|nr:50S ribosomal protein L17 [Gemmatimonadota bacterium]